MKPTNSMVNIVLHRPLIHWNTGNVGRTCLGFGAKLHLIRPFGFELSDSAVRRAGLDYWQNVDLEVHDSWDAFEHRLPELGRPFFLSKSAKYGQTSISDVKFPSAAESDLCLIFGNEIKGLEGANLDAHATDSNLVYFPMNPGIRSFNLSTTVAMTLFEAQRQRNCLPENDSPDL